MPDSGRPVVSPRRAALGLLAGVGAAIGYGSLLAFLYLIGTQTYRWFRQGEWTHIGMGDGIRIGLVHCCVKDGGSGRLAGSAMVGVAGDLAGDAQGIRSHSRLAGLVCREHRRQQPVHLLQGSAAAALILSNVGTE
jgi:hypothetical protein